MMDGIRKSLDEHDICQIADAAVELEVDFLLDIINDLNPSTSLFYQCKSSRSGHKRRSESLLESGKLHHRTCGNTCVTLSSASSEADGSSNNYLGQSVSVWATDPVVTPEQMFALGRIVKEQRTSTAGPSLSTSVEVGG